MLFEKLLSASDLPLSENVAYSSAHVETFSYSEAYDTLEQDYATVAAAGKQNIFIFPFGCSLVANSIAYILCNPCTYFTVE